MWTIPPSDEQAQPQTLLSKTQTTMNTDIKQAMHVEAAKSFGTAEANENERRWTYDKLT